MGWWQTVAGRVIGDGPADYIEELARMGQLFVEPSEFPRHVRERLNALYVEGLFVLIATAGRHEFFESEKGVRDLREHPIRFAGYSISYRRGVDRRFHVSVRIAPDEYLRLKAFFVELACHRSVDGLAAEFSRLPFEPYAPVRRQLLNILRAVNRERQAAGFEPVPVGALRLRRRIVKPFFEAATERKAA